MADAQHSSLPHASVHEPRNISISGLGDSGKVITNSSSISGQSEYRRLDLSTTDILNIQNFVTHEDKDTSVAKTIFVPAPFTGFLTRITVVIDNPLVTADLVYTILVNGGATTPATLTIVQAGSAIGDVLVTPITSGNSVTLGQNVSVAGNAGNTDATVDATFLFEFTR